MRVEGTWQVAGGTQRGPRLEAWDDYGTPHAAWEPFGREDKHGAVLWRRRIPKVGFDPDFYVPLTEEWDVDAFLAAADVHSPGQVDVKQDAGYVVHAAYVVQTPEDRLARASLVGCSPEQFKCRLEWARRVRQGWWFVSSDLMLHAIQRAAWREFVSGLGPSAAASVQGMSDAIFAYWITNAIPLFPASTRDYIDLDEFARCSTDYCWPTERFEVYGPSCEEAVARIDAKPGTRLAAAQVVPEE